MSERIKVQALIKRELGDVWKLWNEPRHITNWNFASDDWCCPRAQNDLRAGGRLCNRMEAKDGRFGFDFEAIYDEVIHQSKVAYTLTDGRKVQTSFQAEEEKTQVTTTFDAEGENPAAMQRMGWQAILDNFKRYAETAQV